MKSKWYYWLEAICQIILGLQKALKIIMAKAKIPKIVIPLRSIIQAKGSERSDGAVEDRHPNLIFGYMLVNQERRQDSYRYFFVGAEDPAMIFTSFVEASFLICSFPSSHCLLLRSPSAYLY
jgi:hypothetical protein